MQPENKIKNQYYEALEGTSRIEAFSDGLIAIIITILILELHVPEIHNLTNVDVWEATMPLLPKFAGFLLSFITVAIFWVNHHHFFHAIKKTNGGLLWYNNHLLFWLAVVPFVTAFVGDYPTIPLVVAVYGFVLFMGALAFSLMIRYVFFKGDLLPETISAIDRKIQYRRSWPAVIFYGLSVPLAFLHPYLSLAIFVLLPIYYFVPQSVGDRSF